MKSRTIFGMGPCLLLCTAALLMVGCAKKKTDGTGADSDTDSGTGAHPGSDAETDTASDSGTDTATPAGDIFSDDKVHLVALTLPDAQWQTLQATAQDEQYTQADVTIDGTYVGTSGLRFKGSYGNLYGCFDDAGEQICSKLSMKLKFSEYVDEQRFQGLKRLNLHSMERDNTLLAEQLGYALYRDMGVMTSRTSFAEVSVNGENLGLYAVVEQIDGRFTASRFEDSNGDGGDGDLYKEAWPFYADADYWTEHLKTNKETATHANMIAFTNALQTASDETLPQLIANYVDVDYMLQYMAVNEAINNWDGITMWYCIPEMGGCGNHNYYWYQEETRPFFWLLPWDLDSTFVTKSWNGNPPRWNDLNVNCDEPMRLPETTYTVYPPSCDPLTRGLALVGRDRFAVAVNALLDGYFNDTVLNQRIDSLVALITPAVERDPDRSVSAWLPQVDALRQNISALRDRLIYMRDGGVLSPTYISGDSVYGFESDGTVGLQMTTFVMGNPGTTVDFVISDAAPLNGAKDLRMNFEFFDDGVSPWDQWAFGELMLDAEYDYSTLVSLRFTAVADTERSMAVRLGSLASTTQNTGASWGWDFTVSATPQTFELSAADLAYPFWWNGAQDDKNIILQQVNAIRIMSFPNSVGANGLMSAPETAFIQMDDIEFVLASSEEDTDTAIDTDSISGSDTVVDSDADTQ